MSTRTFATRMTCFSLVSAIETDIRRVLSNMDAISPIQVPSDVRSNSEGRYLAHFGENVEEDAPLIDLFEFSDFSDLAKVLSKNKNCQSLINGNDIEWITGGLRELVAVRNRVCHSRPLEYNDINDLTDFSASIKKIGESWWWANINEALDNLDNPSFALSLQIPSYWQESKNSIYNNLPLPEFDDTGFLGRKSERDAIRDLIFSHTRVISLVGEGGVGKTALALRCLYDVLELAENSDDAPFDMVIWVSLKANRLTSSGVVLLRNAIMTSLGLYQSVASSFGGKPDGDIEELLAEISQYMDEFRILLCIDNLETIDKVDVRRFLAEIPDGSKVLITTRVGLGEIEYRYKLDSLDSKSSIDLIRSLARLLNIEALQKKNNSSLKDLARRLYNNPLLIKWYVLGIGGGKRGVELLTKQSKNYQEALKFCFENLYEGLNEIELDVIQTVECLRQAVSAVELRFILGDRDELEIVDALHSLNNSSMLKSEVESNNQDDGIRRYALTDIASDYLTSVKPISEEFYTKVRRKNKELKRHLEQELQARNRYHLDVSTVHAENKDEKICAVYLKQALKAAKKDKLEEALGLVQKAKSMKPDFSECYRVNAHLLRNSPHKAESEYEAALECNPESIITYYAFSQFLLNDSEYESAEEQIDRAIQLAPDEEALLSLKALILTRSGSYPEALSLYEKILPSQKENKHRKFRISTYQQVVDCYVRYASNLIDDSDLKGAVEKNNRALSLITEALDSDNYDDRTFVLFKRLLLNADRIDSYNSNIEQTSSILQTLEHYRSVYGFHNKIKLHDELSFAVDKMQCVSKGRFIIFLDDLEAKTQINDSLFHGNIKSVVCKAGANVSFGFISGDDKKEYFFHRGDLNPNDVLDNSDVSGRRVAFNAAESDRGPTAKNVHLL